MIIHTRQRRFAFLAAFHVTMWSATGYFLISAQTGDRGLAAKQEAREKTDAISREIATLKAERTAWERKVAQLSGPEIDRDLLDERLRAMLGVAHKNDVVILLDKP